MNSTETEQEDKLRGLLEQQEERISNQFSEQKKNVLRLVEEQEGRLKKDLEVQEQKIIAFSSSIVKDIKILQVRLINNTLRV